MFTHAIAVEEIKVAFPELRADMENETWRGLLHLEIGCFARFTQERIDAEDREGVQRCFALADRIFANCDPVVENAFYVSYLEHLELKDGKKRRAWAMEFMPPRLQRGYTQINRYMDGLSKRKGSPRRA